MKPGRLPFLTPCDPVSKVPHKQTVHTHQAARRV